MKMLFSILGVIPQIKISKLISLKKKN